MIDEETYKKEIVRMWDTLRADENKGEVSCEGVYCGDCPLQDDFANETCTYNINAFKVIKIVEMWSKEHQQKKHKISRIEYMILENEFRNMRQGIANLTHYANRLSFDTNDFAFNNSYLLSDLISYGYYEGANFDTNIKYYLDNCEVVD